MPSRRLSMIVILMGAAAWGGCESAPPPEGFHYEYRGDKRATRVLVKDADPNPTFVVVSQVEIGHDVPEGPDEHFMAKNVGKTTRLVVVRDVETKFTIPTSTEIEVSPDDICPLCTQRRVLVGKRTEYHWICDSVRHGRPPEAGAPASAP